MLEARHIPTVPSLEAGSSLGILMSHLGIMCMWKIKEKEEKKKGQKQHRIIIGFSGGDCVADAAMTRVVQVVLR